MTFKYYTSGSYTILKPSDEQWRDGFQANITDQFANSSTYQTILEETAFASGSTVSVNVRVTSAVDSATGIKLSDDYKKILFSDITKESGLGWKYYFSSNWWVCSFSDDIKSTPKSITVRRCNNVLRWTTSDGISQSEPCAIDYDLSRTTDMSTKF